MAEWSKAVDLGSIPKGRGFKPHLQHFLSLFLFFKLFFLSIDSYLIILIKSTLMENTIYSIILVIIVRWVTQYFLEPLETGCRSLCEPFVVVYLPYCYALCLGSTLGRLSCW